MLQLRINSCNLYVFTLYIVSAVNVFEFQDHETTSQSLLEKDATLHVLTDAEFRFIKPNVSRQFLGKLALK